jgi:tRNA (guanine26-N2/guanine27-N2)-dimethyltransferase
MAINESNTVNFPSKIIREGKVQVLVPDLQAYGVVPSDYAPSKAPVFYNPIMEFNRDLAILAFKAYQHIVKHEITICEPLTSQGIRGIRYAAEIEGVQKLVLSDINKQAYELADYNIRLNKLEHKITLEHQDANCVLSCNASPKKRFDIIDVDPFGTPVHYLDSALRATKNKGMLAVTATDLAPLCGVHAKACVRKYGGKPLRTEYCHELAVRLLAGCMASLAARHDSGIRILFSHSSNHYIRVYGQIYYGCKKADQTLENIGYIFHCFNCMHRETTRNSFSNLHCPECGAKMEHAGPLWIDRIIDLDFLDSIIKESKKTAFKNNDKISNLLTLSRIEALAPATYYVVDKLSGKFNLPTPSVQEFIAALRTSGFQAAQTHFNSRGIKTNASATTMQSLLKRIVSAKNIH